MNNIAFLNDNFVPLNEAKISVLDRGFLFADGVYEVIPVYAGKLFRLDAHLARLNHSLSAIDLSLSDWNDTRWRDMLETLVARNGGGHLSVYLQVTRGPQPVRDHRIPDNIRPTVFAMCQPMPVYETIEALQPIRCALVEDIRWMRCDIKSIALLGNVLAKHQATVRGADEALLIRDGYVNEGSASNLFVVLDDQIVTPPKSNLILGGITRDLVIELLLQNKMRVHERPIAIDDLKRATEVWVSSSTREIRAVIEIDGKPVGRGACGPMWRKAAEIYHAYKQKLIQGGADDL